MSLFTRIVLIFNLAVVLNRITTAQNSFPNCDLGSYYGELPGSGTQDWTRADLHELVRTTHRNSLPYTFNAGDDVWKALIDLDGEDAINSEGEVVRLVRLVYSNELIPAIPFGDTDTWNREHLWPQSRGVQNGGMDFTDVHSLKPADANVNSARGNLFFGACGLFENENRCRFPANDEAANDTSADGTVWLPPAVNRGDIARALFYMDVRYDGSDDQDLVLTDCPNPRKDNEMAYLSQLLEWNLLDPPNQEERDRNNRICERWQGNRNPFVDFPELAGQIFGSAQFILPETFGYNCTDNQAAENGSCKGLNAGDVMVNMINSANPDTVGLVALTDVPGGIDLFMTDNAWTGDSFLSNEGTIKLTVPEDGIEAGSVFGFDQDSSSSLSFAGSWSSEAGTFALAAAGDSVLIYCSDDSTENVVFLGGLSYNGPWAEGLQSDSDFGTSLSALPVALASVGSVSLPHFDNYIYSGTGKGTKENLQKALMSSGNWVGTNSERHSTEDIVQFVVSNSPGDNSIATMVKFDRSNFFLPVTQLLFPLLLIK